MTPSPPRVRGLTANRAWWISFGLFLGMAVAWSLTAPLFSGPDEPAHVIKAAGVARGQFIGRATELPTIGVMRVPVGIASANDVPGCFAFKSNVSALCAPDLENGYSTSEALTKANLYPPVYYIIVGWPSRLAPSVVAIYLMRLVNAVLCAALIASAVASASAFRRPRPMLIAVALTTTPMVIFLSGVVNPSAVEIASAICFWVSAALIISEPQLPNMRRVVIRTGIAAGLLASMRWFSPVWLGLVVLILVGCASRATLAALARERWIQICAGVAIAAALFTGIWTLLQGDAQQTTSLDPSPAHRQTALATILRGVVGRQDFNVRQMIGFFGWLDTPSPSLTYYLWFLMLGFILFLSLICCRGRVRNALIATALLTFALPIAVETIYFRYQGFFWQGRYTMPLAVGVVILAGLAIAQEPLPYALAKRTTPIFAGISMAHILGYLAFAQRFSVGQGGRLNFLSGPHWSPPVPFPILVVLALVGSVAYSYWLLAVVAQRERASF